MCLLVAKLSHCSTRKRLYFTMFKPSTVCKNWISGDVSLLFWGYYKWKVKVKVFSLQAHRGPQPRHYEEVGWLVLCSAAFTPRESPQYSFYRGAEWTPGPVWTRRSEENFYPSDTRAIQSITKHLAARVSGPYIRNTKHNKPWSNILKFFSIYSYKNFIFHI